MYFRINFFFYFGQVKRERECGVVKMGDMGMRKERGIKKFKNELKKITYIEGLKTKGSKRLLGVNDY